MSRAGYAKMVLGKSPIERRTALACAALAAGLEEWQSGPVAQHLLEEPK
ncbi:hypothetical protein [Acidovorax sp. SUPP2539]|nr:hypothetical protein [Acidovorax sp. SUPP2539]